MRVLSLLEDKARIDWLEENFRGVGPSLKHEGFEDYYEVTHVGRRATSIKSSSVPGPPSLREAIDAAKSSTTATPETASLKSPSVPSAPPLR